jgi:protein-L-isoaspartate(D-aspartate) O-methyltransferase
MHAACLEALASHLTPGAKALDVGSGSGYLTACMGAMVRPDGVVYGIEHVPELVIWSDANMQTSDACKALAESRNVVSE